MASIGMSQAAAGALAFLLTDALMPQWEYKGVDISATFLNISGELGGMLVGPLSLSFSLSLSVCLSALGARTNKPGTKNERVDPCRCCVRRFVSRWFGQRWRGRKGGQHLQRDPGGDLDCHERLFSGLDQVCAVSNISFCTGGVRF